MFVWINTEVLTNCRKYKKRNPPYLWILYLWICLLIKFICNSKINVCSMSAVVHDMYRAAKKTVAQCARSQLRVMEARLCILVSALLLWTIVCFAVYLMPHFLHFCPFCWFCCLKCPWCLVLKCWLVFPSTRRLWYALWRKYIVLFILLFILTQGSVLLKIDFGERRREEEWERNIS